MGRRCSQCSNNGHNSRTCPDRSSCGGVRLFGVRLTDRVGPIKKSASMGNLTHHASPVTSDPARDHAAGYASDDTVHASCSSNFRNERKKGTPWTEEEHRMFLQGLQKLGKGDWRGISRTFVVSRTPTQVASHAQKYFIRQANASRRKRRSSLFDMVPESTIDHSPAMEDQILSLGTEVLPSKSHPESKEEIQANSIDLPPVSTFYPTLMPVPIPFWPSNLFIREEEMVENHEILKPTPVVLRKDIVNGDELVRLSNLSIGGVYNRMKPSALSVKLLETSASRQSAFHTNPSFSRPGLNQNGVNVIHAV